MKSQTTLRRLLGLNFGFVSVSLRAKHISEWADCHNNLTFGDGTVGNGDGAKKQSNLKTTSVLRETRILTDITHTVKHTMNIHTKKIRRLLGLTLGVQGLGNCLLGTAIGASRNRSYSADYGTELLKDRHEKAISIEQVTLQPPETFGVELWT